MQPEPGTILLVMTLFAVKHFIADFVLQSNWMVAQKGRYGQPGGIVHAVVHMGGSIPALMVLGAGPWLMAVLVLGEGVVHYHLDYLKERVSRHLGLGAGDKGFWVLLGADQALHHLTYVVIVWVFLAVT